MKKTLLLLSIGMIFLLVNSSCKKEDPPVVVFDCSTVTYSGTIKQLVADKCSGTTCHAAGAQVRDYSSYDKIKGVAIGGQMRKTVLELKTMPLVGELTAEELDQVKCWLDAGAPDN